MLQLWFSKHDTHCTRCPDSISLQMGCSAKVNQNSQASKATFSSGSCVLCSMYCKGSKEKRGTLSIIVDQWAGCLISRWSVSRPPTWMMLCMWGMRRSMRTSSNMTRARHTFFRTSESSSAARANRLYTRISIWYNKGLHDDKKKKRIREKLTFTFTALPHGGATHLYEGVNVVH